MIMDQRIEQQIEQHLAGISFAADHFPGIVTVLNLRTLGVEYMSARGLRALGTTLPALRTAARAYHETYFNPHDGPQDLPQLLGLLAGDAEGDDDAIIPFLQHVRAAEHLAWSWYMSTVRVSLRDAHDRPLLALSFASPVGSLRHLTPKLARLLEENVFLRQNQPLFDQLTRREREVLRLLVLGKNSAAIADELFISPNTVITHRRNINAKLHPETPHDLSRYAYAYDLV